MISRNTLFEPQLDSASYPAAGKGSRNKIVYYGSKYCDTVEQSLFIALLLSPLLVSMIPELFGHCTGHCHKATYKLWYIVDTCITHYNMTVDIPLMPQVNFRKGYLVAAFHNVIPR